MTTEESKTAKFTVMKINEEDIITHFRKCNEGQERTFYYVDSGSKSDIYRHPSGSTLKIDPEYFPPITIFGTPSSIIDTQTSYELLTERELEEI
jgi:hypothetical protein